MEAYERMFKWRANPFTFTIMPEVFVGYSKEMAGIISGFESGNKFSLVTGPTGSGKTTFLKAAMGKLNRSEHVMYLPKPPKVSSDWITVFNPVIKYGGRFRLPFGGKVSLYNLGEKLNSSLQNRRCILLIDECHEATTESLEWLRALSDHTDNLSIVLAALPVFEDTLKEKLETFMRRISSRAELSSLSKPETREFIKKRIEFMGGDDIRPFTSSTVEYIFDKTGGFPREILRLCNSLLQKSAESGITTIDIDFLEEAGSVAAQRLSADTISSLPQKQRAVLDILKGREMTTAEITSHTALDDYKNRDIALRSANNLLKRLMDEKMVERVRCGRTYKYRLSGGAQTLMVSA